MLTSQPFKSILKGKPAYLSTEIAPCPAGDADEKIQTSRNRQALLLIPPAGDVTAQHVFLMGGIVNSTQLTAKS
jgi:hypothetical protein